MTQLMLRLPPKGMRVSGFASDEDIERMLHNSPVHSGRIRSNPPGSFQYRYGRKISPKDWTLLDKLPL